jgi:hypothetical protein
MVTYGQQAWSSELSSVAMLALDVLFILVFVVDVSVQFNTGYITRGAIILDRSRVINRYLHYYFYFDLLLLIVLFVALASRNYYLNYPKLLIIFKFMRMLQINGIIDRKLSTKVAAKTTYIVVKQLLTIFILSHSIGLIFWLISNSLINNTTVCSGDN